jgi:long-chain acyl-CoA synthetase
MGCPVRQGYGATETSAASVTQEICDNSSGVVGPPRASCCIKLVCHSRLCPPGLTMFSDLFHVGLRFLKVDWEEGGYRFTDKDNAEIGVPRGEILIGGPLVCSGYLVDEEDPNPELVEKNQTDFSVDADGIRWFHTGDIGQVDKNGCLKVSQCLEF